MRTRTWTRPLAALAAGLLVLGLAACGDDDEGAAATEDDAGVTVVAQDNSFPDGTVTATPGQTVRLDNQGSNPHTVTADDGAFDTGRVDGGTQGELTAPTEPGTYAFHCDIHPAAMTGTLTVA